MVCVVVRVRVEAGEGGRQASGERGWHPVDGWMDGWDKVVCVCVCVCVIAHLKIPKVSPVVSLQSKQSTLTS